MIHVRTLQPHDPLPEGHRLSVLRRFDTDDPRRVVTEINLSVAPGRSQVVQPTQPDGTPMTLDDAIAAARRVAEEEGVTEVFVLDRTAGPLEHEVVEHGGDHGFDGRPLQDTDPEDGERGPDMRDRTP